MRILFIDDDVVFFNVLSEILEKQSIQVDQAESAKSVIELADICDYPTIILDLSLPDMTGNYGRIDEPEMRFIGVFICKLRRKIGREMQDTALIELV